jgi:RAD51-like protein 1
MDKPIQRVTALNNATIESLRKNKITTCGQIYQYSEIFLAEKLDLNVYDVRSLIIKISDYVKPRRETAWELLKHKEHVPSFLPTKLHQLDLNLKGGIPAGTITELVGHAGVGKTQMCLTLAALATMPSMSTLLSLSSSSLSSSLNKNVVGNDINSSGVIYIDTEQKFNATRLYEIIQERIKSEIFYQNMSNIDSNDIGINSNNSNISITKDQLDKLCKNAVKHVTVFTLPSCKEVVERLSNIQRLIIEKNVRLLLVDSVAAVARQEYSSIVHRQQWLNKQASLLKFIAERFDIPVIVTNQVTTTFRSSSNTSNLLPALGNTWSHCVNTRLLLNATKEIRYFNNNNSNVQNSEEVIKHVLKITKSPLSGPIEVQYDINERGIVDF